MATVDCSNSPNRVDCLKSPNGVDYQNSPNVPSDHASPSGSVDMAADCPDRHVTDVADHMNVTKDNGPQDCSNNDVDVCPGGPNLNISGDGPNRLSEFSAAPNPSNSPSFNELNNDNLPHTPQVLVHDPTYIPEVSTHL